MSAQRSAPEPGSAAGVGGIWGGPASLRLGLPSQPLNLTPSLSSCILQDGARPAVYVPHGEQHRLVAEETEAQRGGGWSPSCTLWGGSAQDTCLLRSGRAGAPQGLLPLKNGPPSLSWAPTWVNQQLQLPDFLFATLGRKRPVGEGEGVSEGGGVWGKQRWALLVPPHRALRGVAGAPAPTFLQLLVGKGPARDQQHSQQHQGQDDAHHRAGAQARRVGVLAWGAKGGTEESGWPHPSIKPVHSGGGCWLASARESPAHASVWPPLRCLRDSGYTFTPRLFIT